MKDERNSNAAQQERRIGEAIRSTGNVRADASFRERLKREFSAGTIAEPAVQPRETVARGLPRWTWFLVPAAAAAVLIVVLLLPQPAPTWAIQAVNGEGQVEIDGQALASDDPDLIARALRDGGRIRLPDGVALDLRLDDRLVLALVEGTEMTVPRLPEPASEGPLITEVRAGELKIKTGPGFPGTELHILTSEGRTEIVGTIISVYKGDGYTCVCVLKGTALVGVDETSLEEVPPGKLKIMFSGGRPPIVTDIVPQHEADLLEFGGRYEDLFQPSE